MFVKHFEIINCTIIAFSRCDSITAQKAVLSERYLHGHDQVPPLRNRFLRETHTEISTRAVREAVRKVWSSFPQPASKFVLYLREMEEEVNNSNLSGSRM